MEKSTTFNIDVDHRQLMHSLQMLNKLILPCDKKQLDEVCRLWEANQLGLEKLVDYLSEHIVNQNYTAVIKLYFSNILFLIVTKRFLLEAKTKDLETHQEECICLSNLIDHSVHISNHALLYFKLNSSPFSFEVIRESKRKTKKSEIRLSSLDIVKCCYNFLKVDYHFYKNAWKWSEFFKMFFNNGCDLQKLHCNYIMAMLTGMSVHQLKDLNASIPKYLILENQIKIHKIDDVKNFNDEDLSTNLVQSTFCSNVVCCIEGVILPIFNASNKVHFQRHDEADKIVDVSSTKTNMRSIALGISSNKAICLTGPVGCGKTTLVEHLANLTGRIGPSSYTDEIVPTTSNAVSNDPSKSKQKSMKRPSSELKQSDSEVGKIKSNNGFLRIQLGDQTDSKMLLGQYRCTDVPGEFVWQAGVLTQAVMNGQWLLLEDIDSATQDVTTVLTNLMENRYLSVPGFRDCVRIVPGFQLFVTLRNQKLTNHLQQSNFQILEKYLYIINMLPLSRNELCNIISTNYPKLSTISDRIVDVYLEFSKGMHQLEKEQTNNEDIDICSTSTTEKMTLAGLSNANRLVSTRDLFKFCKRSNPSFSVTSAECAYNVFQNAVDLFCSYLPHGIVKTQLITNIGAKLGITQLNCEYYADQYKPEVNVAGAVIKCGRIEVNRRLTFLSAEKRVESKRSTVEKDESIPQKKKKIDKTVYVNVYQESKKKCPTFSFTRLSACILEKIAIAVQHNEPVLLVGETGVGKTSSVQYLAHQTNHKLVVVNMNNQSDVSDLIGGYKPVDLGFVISPMRSEFEFLFKKTFISSKNEKFLNNLSICFNRSNFTMIIKLMLKVCETVFNKKTEMNLQSMKSNAILTRWKTLRVKLLRLDSQLKHSINISFAFIPGSLVNCIKNGDWVLLDEINLASTETLECLSTILEPDGSIVLLEKGDYVPIKRHSDFRIFACMNPSTDIGKKDLSVGIRNRFTEFFVDELTMEEDLMILIGDYLSTTGIQKKKVNDIVKFYGKLRKLAHIELNDGLGNRPVYSLRTLCRSLSICAKNLCGSIERNLYESFCVGFLTQLDPASHKIVQLLIQQALLSDTKAILNKEIPKPTDGDYINFEGYWIQNGPQDVLECENYILTASVKQNLKDLARIISIGRLPVLLQGPTSAGKTSLIEYVAKRSGNFCLRINNHEHTDLQEYIGSYTSDENGKLSFKEGVLVQAMRNGYWIILDELNLAPSDILEALNRVLDDNRELFIPETQTLVKAHPNFMLFATQNPPGLYGGRKTLSRAFKNRFIELHFSEIPKDELEVILEKRCLIPKSYAQKMVKTMYELQINRKRTTKGSFTLRDLFRWGNRYTYADAKLMENKTYDWNQHLVDEGFLVLSSKIRDEGEVDVIEKSLFKHFRKRIELKNLFILHDATSLVTKNILEKLENCASFQNIVWTFNMKRMAVLAAKGIEFSEPILLVGPTGCGKTTVCQILADVNKMDLKILNCHMHTEGADFLGGLRPFRTDDNENKRTEKKQLFEWANGPLVTSMLEGNYFLADEISLAEDSVLERLNCVLEPERTLLLSEKGGANENVVLSLSDMSNEFVIKAKDSFKFFATMNPGGDFGKKELSPALRNRFTEIWCRATENKEDLVKITAHALKVSFNCLSDPTADMMVNDIAQVIVNTVDNLKQLVDKLNFSIRDILAWVAFIGANSHIIEPKALTIYDSLYFGLETLFLDSLEMLPYETYNEIENIRSKTTNYLIKQIREHLQKSIKQEDIQAKRGFSIENTDLKFGINPFFIPVSANLSKETDFMFTAPTTQQNLFRLLSALSLNKAVLLEGPPGVGKTSLIENLAKSIGYNIVRINLCEHTDLTDLFGTDLPAEDKDFENKMDLTQSSLGSFIWRDGPLLSALKAESTWILLDELNLAPQSVLEGLNAILDHRGEVFIPELNKTFKLGRQTRIFASQNPLRQGGGRKGLPQSFLNRFTKVYLRKLATNDLMHVVNGKYEWYFQTLAKYFEVELDTNDNDRRNSLFNTQRVILDGEQLKFDLVKRLVTFSEHLDEGITNFEFGHKGGPFEVNLRDILRWCEFLSNEKTGFVLTEQNLNIEKSFGDFLLVLYEKMKLVYYFRMRTAVDKSYVRSKFAEVFSCNVDMLEAISQDISLYWNDETMYLNDIEIRKSESLSLGDELTTPRIKSMAPLVLTSQLENIKNLAECVINRKPVILCGATDCGKTKTVDVLCTIMNRNCIMDTIDDSVTGSFQQVDLNRHLEEIAKQIEVILVMKLQQFAFESFKESFTKFIELLRLWENYVLSLDSTDASTPAVTSAEVLIFKNRQLHLQNVFAYLLSLHVDPKSDQLLQLRNKLKTLSSIVGKTATLNTGGHFEWVDSKIVKSLKYGQYICLEHVNLCSSAILDRLNPIFEPNGSLLISEKGVSVDNEPDIVMKHNNFCAFLTLDPKHGEISRAMRNRCIEINFHKENYNIDDLKRLVFVNGVKDICLIDCVLNIHKRVSDVSDFNVFGVSHIIKCSFLVAENKRQGCSNIVSIQNSAFEVYVRSSNTDLLGFGLDFYRKKLENEILEEIQSMKLMDNIINYDNIVLTTSDLSALSLIRWQSEPFLAMVRCHELNLQCNEVLPNGFSKFNLLPLDASFESVCCMLLVIYDASSPEDVEQRKTYLEMSLSEILPSESAVIKSLQKLNKDLYKAIVDAPSLRKLLNKAVPWNSKMFPRLRNYKNDQLTTTEQLKISAELITKVVSKDIVTRESIKLNQIDVITYSKAVQSGNLQDTLRNDFIFHVYPLLLSVPEFIEIYLRNSSIVTYETYSQMICNFLWSGRMYSVTTQLLLKNKKLNENMLDKLLLHFGWLQKHLINPLRKLSNTSIELLFDKPYGKMSTYAQLNFHPLNQVRKEYVKKFTNFMPYYEEHQILLHEFVREFSNLVNLVAHMGQFEKDDLMRKIKIIFNENTMKTRKFLVEYSADGLEWLNQDDGTAEFIDTNLDLNCNTISDETSITDIIQETKELFFGNINHANDIDSDALRKLNDFLPVAEYFAMKSLTPLMHNKSVKHSINLTFFNLINTINVELLQVLQATKNENYKHCESTWSQLLLQLNNEYESEGENHLQMIIATLPNNFYKNYSSFNRRMISQLRQFSMNSISIQSDIFNVNEFGSSEYSSYNRSILTTSVMNALLDAQGHFKSTGLGEVDIWRGTLNLLSKVIWYNVGINNQDFLLEKGNLDASLNHGMKLLIELDWIKDQYSNENQEFFSDFVTIIKSLEKKVTECNADIPNQTNTFNNRFDQHYSSSILNALIGSIELNLLSFMPIIDPVEKNRLKKVYNDEDTLHIKQILSAYDSLKVVMNYQNLNEEILVHLRSKLDEIEIRKLKFSKKVALRPNECIYGNLVRDINHFLSTCCHPKILHNLISLAEETLSYQLDFTTPENNIKTTLEHLQNVGEIIKKIDLWINNAQQFKYHTLTKYSAYYRDFLTPMENSITTTKFGLVGLQSCLIRSRDSICMKSNGTYFNINNCGEFTVHLGRLIEFPSVYGIDVLPVHTSSSLQKFNITTVLNQLPNYDECYFMLVKSKLQEIRNEIEISKNISDNYFSKFDSILNICNMIWMEQEEVKRKKLAEDESLYVHKTHCETKDEEEVILEEIQSMFPTDIDNDFGEFIQSNTLEKIVKKTIPTKTNKSSDALSTKDMKLLCQSFIDIMQNFSRCYYYKPSDKVTKMHLDFITSYKMNISVFNHLLKKYKSCLNSKMDETLYGGLALIIGLSQQKYDFIQLTEKFSDRSYDFYRDSNMPEILGCTEVLRKIEIRTNEELNQWPDHAVLIDIQRIVLRIRSLPLTSSVVRFSTGFQLLHQKLDEWNKLAHKNNHMKDLEYEVAQHIQRWMKLELQFWRECLTQSFEKMEQKGCKYWFFIYNLIHEYLHDPKDQFASCDLSDITSVEKCFGTDDVIDKSEIQQTQKRLKSNDVVSVLKQFIESSNFAEFSLRMSLLKGFEQYLHYINMQNKRRDNLIKILHNLHLYYEQFRFKIVERIKAIRVPIEKELKKIVKIESYNPVYNKDISYFNMRINIARVHRKLHKNLKEFEKLLNEKISAVFQLKENSNMELVIQNEKAGKLKTENDISVYMVEVKYFLAPTRSHENVDQSMNLTSNMLLSRIPKLLGTSRNIVKQVVLQSHFPTLLHTLDALLNDEIESCEYLRKLEVDRSQIKSKQKVQAKQFLSQKRKALADVYKILSQLGLNYRTGLMENALSEEIVDLKIRPFCIRSMIFDPKHNQIDKHFSHLINNLDLYYAKCVFKLKLLQTILLTPHVDLGHQHVERIKGFSIDLYLLVQSQRKNVSDSVKDIYDFHQQIIKVTELKRCVDSDLLRQESLQFEHLRSRNLFMKDSLVKICSVFRQYIILLKCVPLDIDENYHIFMEGEPFCQSSKLFIRIQEATLSILNRATGLLGDIQQNTAVAFHDLEILLLFEGRFNEIFAEMKQISNELKYSKRHHMVIGSAIFELLEQINNSRVTSFSNEQENDLVGNDNINSELENIIVAILLPLQSIYKKYSKQAKTLMKATTEEMVEDNAKTRDSIEDNHLKTKINYELLSDIEILNVGKITKKLTNILLTIQYGKCSDILNVSQKLIGLLPVMEQYHLFCKFYLTQLIGAHKVSTKMLSVLLTVFVELGAKGFCIPPDLMQDEDGESKQNENKKGEGFGLEDGTGENDVSDKIESEDQLDTAKKPGDDKESKDENDPNCKEERGIDMSEDFDSKLQDVEKPADNSDDSDQSDNDDEADKQMGETEDGAEKLDEQIWGSDEEKQESDEEELNDEQNGKGSNEDKDAHNDLDANKNDEKQHDDEQREGLDAADNEEDKKKKQNDIDKLADPEVGDDQINPYHNELEDPPEPDDLDLGDNFNLDKEDGNENEETNEDNPFDIDKMKENMEVDEAQPNEEETEASDTKDQNDQEVDSDSESDSEDIAKKIGDECEDVDQTEQEEAEENTETTGKPDDSEKVEPSDDKEEKPNETNDYNESKDKPSREENIQAKPDEKSKGSSDQVQIDQSDKEQKQDDDMDAQDTGEDKEGTGQAENEDSKSGHQGYADSKETKSNDKPKQKELQEKRKHGNTNEDRTVSNVDQKEEKKLLKTIDKLNEKDVDDSGDEEKDSEETNEYQHIKDAKKTDKTTLDNATEEQSKQVHHEDNADDETPEHEEGKEDLMETEEFEENKETKVEEMKCEPTETKSNKPSKERNDDNCETKETIEVEGETVLTHSTLRSNESSAHCIVEILQDASTPSEPSVLDTLQLRMMFDKERSSTKMVHPEQEDFQLWQTISNKMLPNARELCEQLRLILEPTKCTRLKGDYRTGRRINMKKIIPYIASQFRKDKIWLRRTKPAQRDYKITIAIDDSKSMHHNNSKNLTLMAISLVSQALKFLESGRLSIVSFGEAPQIILNHSEQFDGPKLVNSLNFSQNESRIGQLLDFTRIASSDDAGSGSDNGIFENLLLILSDGRNVFSEGEQYVRNAVKLARLQRIFIVYIIIDNPENKHSILDIRVPSFSADRKSLTMNSYLDSFPFPYYVIVRDLSQLPLVLSDAMRQWFELVNSEQ